MRLGLFVLMVAMFSCVATPAYSQQEATALISAENELLTQNSALDEAKQLIVNKQIELKKQQSLVTQVNKQSKSVNSKFSRSKAQLATDYAKMLNTPDYDIAPSQLAYQKAWAEVKVHQDVIWNAQQKEQELNIQLVQLKQNKKQIDLKISALQEDLLRQRVKLLRAEINQTGSEKVSFINTCSTNMTIDKCVKQSATLALQKAVRAFQSHLIDKTTESILVKQNERSASFNIHVLKYENKIAEFFDDAKFKTVLDVSLSAKPAKNAPCKLLNIDSQYCFAPTNSPDLKSNQKESAWFNLTIYSNKFYDNVEVDGVSYGSTPVEIMLSDGSHLITVKKEGYQTFYKKLNIDKDQTIRTTLIENENMAESGEQFADIIGKQIKAPAMSVITQGRYHIGENANKSINLNHGYAISSSPITTQQFSLFVAETSYKTDAEVQQKCSAVTQSNITSVTGQYWRYPGFKQDLHYPVVCISQNDAKAYTRWLSKQTGFEYRLPTANEWEIAARGGSSSNYWWGDEFGTGRANTGWGGTSWSNNSTSPVATFKANKFGLFDVVGNVWEWTSESRGLLKGGAWSFSPEKAKAESELFVAPEFSANFTGFRVVRAL